MSSPTKEEKKNYITEIAKGGSNTAKTLKEDVVEMCKLLLKLVKECKKRNENTDLSEGMRKHFTDIYWTLKLHLAFHLGMEDANSTSELRLLGGELGLTDEELGNYPQEECAIDPCSKFLEILGDVIDSNKNPKGSESHAEGVMEAAKGWFGSLKVRNHFRPKVLALVTHDGKVMVGSSVAVSHYLRPLTLYNRICNFEQCLKKAVIFFQPLETADDKSWKSSAFYRKEYKTDKPACKNCKMIFQNLLGFIPDDTSEEKGASASASTSTSTSTSTDTGNTRSFLAACAEYPPVNQLLSDNAEFSPEDNTTMNAALNNYRVKCLTLFKDFDEIYKECCLALKSKDVDECINYVYSTHVRSKVHIFGIKPECNDKF